MTLRPYVVKDITVTPTPTASSSKWSILIPAIIVPIVVVLFLILAFTWAKCAAKRKRERLKVKPHDKVQNSKASVRAVFVTFNETDIYSCEFFLFKEGIEVRKLLGLLVKSFFFLVEKVK